MATLATTDRLLAENPRAAEAVVRGLIDAQKILIAFPERAREVAEKLFPDEANRIEKLVRHDVPFYQPHLTPEFVTDMNRFARDIGILDIDASYAQVVEESMCHLW